MAEDLESRNLVKGVSAMADLAEAVSATYRPRRAVIELSEATDVAELDRVQAPGFQPAPLVAPIPRTDWAAPIGGPAVEDLSSSRWQLGAIVEPLVARELDRLRTADARWDYVNSIPGARNGSEIGHLVVGPGGIFTINARHHHSSRGWMGGDIRCGRHEAQRASRLLTSATRISIRVQGLIVRVGIAKPAVKQEHHGLEIVNSSALVDFLRSQPPYLDGETRARIIGYARLSSTWYSGAGR